MRLEGDDFDPPIAARVGFLIGSVIIAYCCGRAKAFGAETWLERQPPSYQRLSLEKQNAVDREIIDWARGTSLMTDDTREAEQRLGACMLDDIPEAHCPQGYK